MFRWATAIGVLDALAFAMMISSFDIFMAFWGISLALLLMGTWVFWEWDNRNDRRGKVLQ